MIKNLFLLFVCLGLLISCSTYNSMRRADSSVRQLALNMTPVQVKAIMGEKYEVVKCVGDTIVWGYKTLDEGMYKLHFVKGSLKKWEKEWFKERDITYNSTIAPAANTSDN